MAFKKGGPLHQRGNTEDHRASARALRREVVVFGLICLSCAPVRLAPHGNQGLLPARAPPPYSWAGPRIAGRSALNQSCGAACRAPITSSTGEVVAPSATRLGAAAEKTVQAVEAIHGFLTLERALTGAELDQVEGIIKECVAQAHADVNESYPRQKGSPPFQNGRFPSDEECRKSVGRDSLGRKITLAQELGRLKHAAAFSCIEARLPSHLQGNFTIEPRYKPDPAVNGVELTSGGTGTLRPDFVVHGTRNATDVQCVYDLKFPCFADHKLNPLLAPGVRAQLESYQKLTKRCPAAVVSPTGLDSLKE
jgi:hypothetical protein